MGEHWTALRTTGDEVGVLGRDEKGEYVVYKSMSKEKEWERERDWKRERERERKKEGVNERVGRSKKRRKRIPVEINQWDGLTPGQRNCLDCVDGMMVAVTL